jgi:hypothetical protein
VGEPEHGERAADERSTLPDPVRRRLDEIFGDVLPDVTRDEQGDAADEPLPAAGDEWLRANRPPHHGG